MEDEVLKKKLVKAKADLIFDHPFVGSIAMGMPFEFSDAIPTAATNGERVLFNPEFIRSLTDKEITFLVAHECLHPMLEHVYRRHDRQVKRWNHACDYVINQLLVDDGIGTMPEAGLLDKELYDKGEGISDNIYNLLPDEDSAEGMSMYGAPQLDECQDAEGTASDRNEQQTNMRIKVAQAAQAAKMMGKLSANMARLVDEVLNPKVDWREVLQQFVQRCRDENRSWARPNRRFVTQSMYLPSRDGEAIGDIAIAVDCSGSISDKEIAQFAAEIRTIHEDQHPTKISVYYFDSEVCHIDEFTRDDEVEVAARGGGGTAFSPIFRSIEERNEEPIACVVLTDLYCGDFGPTPPYPVLWVSNGADGSETPFGQTVMM